MFLVGLTCLPNSSWNELLQQHTFFGREVVLKDNLTNKRETDTEAETERQRQRDGERQRQRDRHRDRHRDRDGDRQTDRDTERQRETEFSWGQNDPAGGKD